jgi:hypothetical protein
MRPLRPLALGIAVALVVAACAGPSGPAGTTPDGDWGFSPAPAGTRSPAGPSVEPSGDAPHTPGPADETAAALMVSTAVWADGGPVLVAVVREDGGSAIGPDATASISLTPLDGGSPTIRADAVIVASEGSEREVVYADLTPGRTGRWRLDVEAVDAGRTIRATTEVEVLESGATPRIGTRAPDVTTPTVADVGGTIALVTTDPQPDPRLSTRSIADARSARLPYVLVIDSWRFRVSTACGRAIPLARYLADKWGDAVVFVHLEPFHYSLVSTTPVLDSPDGTPRLTPIAQAWGMGEGPWPLEAMPWAFVVDGDGVVRSKVTGVFGTDEIDLVLTRIAEG